MTVPNMQERYVGQDGRLTPDGQKLFQQLFENVTSLQAQMAAIAAVTDPTGGATVDAEARTAITAITAAAE